jgi:ribosomal peptide maturation radical SAM protein 1
MPFVTARKPSIQLGLLKSIAAAQGFNVTTFHLALNFARQIGSTVYEALANHRGPLVGDWLFSAAAFGAETPDPSERFLSEYGTQLRCLLTELGTDPLGYLHSLRGHDVPTYLDRMVELVNWGAFQVVGFTSTFQQNAASFALAARIKARYPQVCTLFGGANFDGEMGVELVRSVRCIDYAIGGEADVAFPEFLTALVEGHDPAEVPGVISRNGDSVSSRPRPPFEKLDELPAPDYDEFFERADSLGLLDKGSRGDVYLPFESARGCWWGQKHHCTFCGLNGGNMAFRAKSPERVLDELADLSRRYRTFKFEAVDNILSMSYLETLLPRIASEGFHYRLFYETKANLRREQIRLLSEAGVRSLQPGIESLSSHVLTLMRKGVTAAHNVNVLRWAAYYDICVVWNLIWGFPGETVADYEQQAAVLPHLLHLQPPLSAARIWMERFSPIFFDRESYPVKRLAPEASYAYVYPERMEHERLAYFFDYEFADRLPDRVYEPLAGGVRAWQAAWERPSRPSLTFRYSRDFLQIEDRRDCKQLDTYSLTGTLASLYAACSDGPRGISALSKSPGVDWPKSKIESALDELCGRGLSYRDGDMFLSLAVPAAPGT